MQLCLQHGLTDKRNGLIVFYGCPQNHRKGMHKGGGGRGERKKKKKAFSILSYRSEVQKMMLQNLSGLISLTSLRLFISFRYQILFWEE